MADQFDVIEAGERGRRRWTGLVVALALLLIPVVGLLVSRDPEPESEAAPASRTPGPISSLTTLDNAPNVLSVPARKKGDDEVIQVVFPHGARAEVRYPAELRLAELGSRPYRAGWIDGVFREFVAPYGGEIEVTRGGRALRNYAANVTLWPRQAGSGQYGQVLLFAFGPWRLAMYDRGQGLTFEQRTAVAEGLKGRVTKDGYLVLTARSGVRLAEPGEHLQGESVGPQLWFGGGAGEMVALVPTPDCGKQARMPGAIDRPGRRGEMVCRGDVLVAVTGPPSFRTKAISGIRVTMK
ncbi:hypothetical protein [Nonomuraea rubra]|uniref:hypothetical protein n=1 Tax=Nonomuraea rubra TaxID=46180 RepID=UPI0033DE7799